MPPEREDAAARAAGSCFVRTESSPQEAIRGSQIYYISYLKRLERQVCSETRATRLAESACSTSHVPPQYPRNVRYGILTGPTTCEGLAKKKSGKSQGVLSAQSDSDLQVSRPTTETQQHPAATSLPASSLVEGLPIVPKMPKM